MGPELAKSDLERIMKATAQELEAIRYVANYIDDNEAELRGAYAEDLARVSEDNLRRRLFELVTRSFDDLSSEYLDYPASFTFLAEGGTVETVLDVDPTIRMGWTKIVNTSPHLERRGITIGAPLVRELEAEGFTVIDGYRHAAGLDGLVDTRKNRVAEWNDTYNPASSEEPIPEPANT